MSQEDEHSDSNEKKEGGSSKYRRRRSKRRSRNNKSNTSFKEQSPRSEKPTESREQGENKSPSNRNKNNRKNRRRNKRGGKNTVNRRENIREKSVLELEQEYIEKIKNDDSIEKPLCPICEEPIYIISEAIVHKDTGRRAHFDCVLKSIESEYELSKGERVVYLGGGSFGIIRDKESSHSKMKFFVKERIQYEVRDAKNRIEGQEKSEEKEEALKEE